MYGIECRIFLPQLREQIQINIYVGLEILILYEAQCATYNFNGLIQSGNFNLMSRLESVKVSQWSCTSEDEKNVLVAVSKLVSVAGITLG